VFVPTPDEPPASPRVRELSRRIQQLVADFQREFPMTPAEIRQALLHAAHSTAGGRTRTLMVMAGATAAVFVAGVVVLLGPDSGTVPILALIGGVAVIFGLFATIRRGQ